jgi:hypothetical protein
MQRFEAEKQNKISEWNPEIRLSFPKDNFLSCNAAAEKKYRGQVA